jgi:hypothetical protein
MESNHWNLFVKMVKVVSVPLMFPVFYFRSTDHFSWISSLCLAILFSFAFAGAIRALLMFSYGKRAAPQAASPVRKWRNSIGLILVLFAATLSELYFAWGIFDVTGVKGGTELKKGYSFSLEKAGTYTLWESCDDPDTLTANASQFRIQRVNNGEIVSGKSLFGSAVYRTDGQQYAGICNYLLSAGCSYRLLAPNGQELHKFLLYHSASSGRVLSIFASFFAGALLLILAWNILRNRTNNPCVS